MKFQTKMMISFSLLLIIFGIALSWILYFSSVNLIVASLGKQASYIAEASAKEINLNDLNKIIKQTKELKDREKELPSIMSMPEYLEIREKLWKIKRINGIKFIYTVTQSDDGKYMYVVDGFPLDYTGNDISLPGDIEQNSYSNMDLTYKTKQTYVSQLSNDQQWGANLSTYVPLINEQGEFIGILGVDLEATDIYELIAKNRMSTIGITGVLLLVALAISFYLTKILMNPLKKLTQQVNEVRKGNLEIKIQIQGNDEIRELATSFSDLISVLYFNQVHMDQLLKGFSKAHKIEDLEIRIISEVKKIATFQKLILLEFTETVLKVNSHDELKYADKINAYLSSNGDQLSIGDVVNIQSGYLVVLGRLNLSLHLLWLEKSPYSDAILNQHEQLSLQLISRYSAIFYENLYLVGNMTKKIEELKTENKSPTWLSKLVLQLSEKERRRLASDLHDEVLQEIIIMQRGFKKAIHNQISIREHNITDLQDLDIRFSNLIDSVRETCNELMPPYLMEKGMISTIRALIERIQLRADFNINFETFHLDEEFEFEETLTVYRVIQELINNAIAHSKATELDIRMTKEDGLFTLYYADNGIGMEVGELIDPSIHFGLHGIKERIKVLNGKVLCRSEIGAGLELTCTFPLKKIV